MGCLTMHEVAALVAEEFEVSVEDLRGPSRRRDHAHARFSAQALIRAEMGKSFPSIARFFRRDHTTVVAGVARAAALEANDRAFGAAMARLRAGVRFANMPVYRHDGRIRFQSRRAAGIRNEERSAGC